MAENTINTSAFAIKKLREESAAANDTQIERIADYLISYTDKDATFANLVMQEQKTLSKCMDFIVKKMSDIYTKQNGSKTGGMCADPNDVYLAAIEYYEQDDAAIERQREAEKEKRTAERVAAKAETAKKAMDSPPALKTVAPNTPGTRKMPARQDQLSLFDV